MTHEAPYVYVSQFIPTDDPATPKGEWTDQLLDDLFDGYYDVDLLVILDVLINRYALRVGPGYQRDSDHDFSLVAEYRKWYMQQRWRLMHTGMRDGDDMTRSVGSYSLSHECKVLKAGEYDSQDFERNEELIAFPKIKTDTGDIGVWWPGADRLYFVPPKSVEVGVGFAQMAGERRSKPPTARKTLELGNSTTEHEGLRESITEALDDVAGTTPKKRIIRKPKPVVETTVIEKSTTPKRIIRRKK